MKMKTIFRPTALFVAAALAVAPALGQEHNLRVQTHYPSETINGRNAAIFAADVERMSGGRLKFEMFYSSAITGGNAIETFDAAASGILDADMTGGNYQGGKDHAFQFVGDLLGAYNTPWQQEAWLKFGGGRELADELYHPYNMHLVCWWWPGPESLSSTKPLRSFNDIKGWKFRSPDGLEPKIFQELGASPVVMGFGEVFNALNTGIIEGADASSLANNKGLGIYDIAKHATFPGFHSMPADHFAVNKEKWDSLPDDLRAIIEVACEKLSTRSALDNFVANYDTAKELREQGVTLHAWSPDDLKQYRAGALKAWDEWADTPIAKKLAASHRAFMKRIDLIE